MCILEVKSKRFTTRHRAKVQKKLAEHHRKLNKERKNKPRRTKASILAKDPGIPSMFPGKEEFVSRSLNEREKEKTQCLKRMDLQRLVADVQQRSQEYMETKYDDLDDVNVPVSTITGRHYSDPSKKAFSREFSTVVEKSDVILEILDARDPMGCRVRAVEELVASSGGKKRVVLVLNKIDMVPREVVKQWLSILRREFPTIAFKASTQHQRANFGSSTSTHLDSNTDCLGSATLIQLLKNYCRSLDIKTSIRVGVVGYPNVGKSSIINSLKRSKVCKVGAVPGVTTASQEIHLDSNIKLLDCPGIVFASPSHDNDELAELFLRNCIRIDQLEDPIAPVNLILKKIPVDLLMLLYSIPRFSTTNEFLTRIAHRQGKLKKGGIPNLEAAAMVVLQDWNQGKIPFYTTPPSSLFVSNSFSEANPALFESSSVVPNWAPEFDLSLLEKLEVEHILPCIPESLPISKPIEINSNEISPNVSLSSDLLSKKQQRKLGLSSGKGDTDDGYKFIQSALESHINPQCNKDLAKESKKSKKKTSKLLRQNANITMDVDYENPAMKMPASMTDDATYDFDQDFVYH